MQPVARLTRELLLLAVCLSSSVSAAESHADFLALLRLLPEEEQLYKAAPIFSYMDLRAIERAPALRHSPDALTRSDEPQRWDAVRSRVVSGHLFPVLAESLYSGRMRHMREMVGFGWLEIDREFSFGEAPDVVMILQGNLPDAERLQAALAPRGFERREIGGMPVFHRLEDFRFDLQLRELADPFGGQLGKAARIAVVRPGLLASTAGWRSLERVLAVARGSEPMSRMVPLVEALLPALRKLGAGADASLLQAGAYSVAHLADGAIDIGKLLDPNQTRLEQRRTQPDSVLWPYPLALLFDLQAGMDQINAIALPYPDRDVAAAAADVLAERLAKWSPDDGGKGPSLVEVTGGAIERRVVAVPSETWKAVALVSVRYPLPEASSTQAHQPLPARNLRAWHDAIWKRKFSPLFLINYK